MEDKTYKENKYFRARERVDRLKKFYGNLTSYIIFIIGLGALNYWINAWSYMWFLWAAFGWGIGIFFHAMKTFDFTPFLGKDWEDRKIKEFMENENKSNRWQ